MSEFRFLPFIDLGGDKMGGSGVIDASWKGQWDLSVGMALRHWRYFWSAACVMEDEL